MKIPAGHQYYKAAANIPRKRVLFRKLMTISNNVNLKKHIVSAKYKKIAF
jgi:hypothetical protein